MEARREKSNVDRVSLPLEALGENPSLSLQFLVAPGIPSHAAASFQSLPSSSHDLLSTWAVHCGFPLGV